MKQERAINDTSPIWRYMDLARYALLLSHGLFFARAKSFTDPWGGGWGGGDLRRFQEENRALDRPAFDAALRRAMSARNDALRRHGVSCWHQSDHESAALWELYLPRGLGVAVRSSQEQLRDAVEASSRSLTMIDVSYKEDYSSLELNSDALKLLAHKRPEFAHEKEVRFLLEFRQDELDFMDAAAESQEAISTRPVAPGPPGPIFHGFRPTVTNDPTLRERAAPDGVHLRTNVVRLIERVVLSPRVSYPTRSAVLDLTKAHGLKSDIVIESNVDAIPYHCVRVVDR
jgi:hypothetical protein